MRMDWMRKTCLLLCLVLCLSGSAMAADRKVAMGRYVEVPMDIHGEGWRSFAQAKGTIYAVDGSGDKLLKSLDLNKNHWDQLETGHDEQTSPARSGVTGITVAENGTLYLSSGWTMQNDEGYPYVERIRNGKSERVQLDQRLDTGTDRLALCALDSGELLGLSDIEAYRFSADGVTIQKYAVSGGESIAVHRNELAICSTRNGLITVLHIDSGQVLRTLALPSAASYGVIGYDAKGSLYYVCPDGLYQVNAGDTLMMQIADGRLMSVHKSSIVAQALLFDTKNNPIIAYWKGGRMSLIAYHYDENVATEPGTLLSVFMMYDSKTLRECANKFQQRYPDAMVDIIVALPEDTAVTRDDAIRTLNTEVLAGRGPDILVLDGLPIQSFLNKGVLADLSPVVQSMIASGELPDNLAGSFRKDNAICAVPTRFLLPSIWGDVEGLSTLEDMAAWAQANPSSLPYYAVDTETLVSTFYLSCAPAWFIKDGHLDEGKVEAFLTALKVIRGDWTYETLVQKSGQDFKATMKKEGSRASEWNPYNGSARWSSMEENHGSILMMMGFQKQLPYLLRGVNSSAEINGKVIASNLKESHFAALPGQAEGCFLPVLTMGVSNDSANREVALAFITYALSNEFQSADIIGVSEGFPVNTGALDAMQVNEEMLGDSMFVGGDGLQWNDTLLDQTQRDQLREIIDELKSPVVPDFTLYQMIVQESAPFFEGKIDAGQAARNVCAKANAYLSE